MTSSRRRSCSSAPARHSPTSWPGPCWTARCSRDGPVLLFRVRDPKLKVSVPVRYTGEIPDPFAQGRGGAGDRQQGAAPTFVGQPNSLTTKCPSKYQAPRPRIDGRRGGAADGARRSRAADPRAAQLPSTGSARRCTAPAAAAAPWVDSGRRAMYALAGDGGDRVRDPRRRVPHARTSPTTSSPAARARPRRRSTGPPRSGPPSRARCCCGCCCCRCWSSLALFLTRRRVREIVPYAQAVLFALRTLLRRPRRPVRQPVRDHLDPPAGGRRPGSAAAPHDDDDPPADAVLGLHAADGPVRVRGRGADQRPARAPSGSRSRAASRWPPGCAWGSGSCSARAGPTPSWAGAATGPGIRSRTRR